MATLTRRDALAKALAFGFISITASDAFALLGAFEQAERRSPTVPAALGPFYKKGAPATASLRVAGEAGLPLKVSGRVFDAGGSALEQASVEVWHTDHSGRYDLDGYRYRAKLRSGAQGGYSFDSILPGHYPDRVCQHIHYLVTAPGCKPLVTQMYFATDPVFEGDPGKNFQRDPLVTSIELVRPVVLSGDPHDVVAAAGFDLVLERL